jgi:hypothetical protein
MMTMNVKRLASLLIVAYLVFLGQTVSAKAADIEIEIFYLPHRPAMNVVQKVEKVASEFNNITIRKYDFEDPKNKRPVEKYHLVDHMPIAVFINGKNRFTVNGHDLRLRNFPKGDSFIPLFSGEWDYADLRTILTELAGENK